MDLTRRVFTTAPVTAVFTLSTAAFWVSMGLVSNEAVSLVLFYMFALPSYIVSLISMGVSASFGWAPSRWIAVGLCVAADLILFCVLRLLFFASRRFRQEGDHA